MTIWRVGLRLQRNQMLMKAGAVCLLSGLFCFALKTVWNPSIIILLMLWFGICLHSIYCIPFGDTILWNAQFAGLLWYSVFQYAT
jgi:nucleoside recognition membrane protein YjiH